MPVRKTVCRTVPGGGRYSTSLSKWESGERCWSCVPSSCSTRKQLNYNV